MRLAVVGRAFAVLAVVPFFGAQAQGRIRPGFDLRGAANVLLRGNRVQCNVATTAELCVDPTNSPSLGGGFWPRGTLDQYVFNQGFQVAGIVRGVETSAFQWPGDTVGAYFFDPRGDQLHTTALAGLFNSLDRRHLTAWPASAFALDPTLFHPLVIGRRTVSAQDTWLRYWDGNLNLTNGRVHPAGFLVDQRTMSFTHPALEDAVFVVFRLINISARDPAVYQQLTAAGYDQPSIDAIAAAGAAFQEQMEERYPMEVPDDGYTLDSLYVAFAQDPDIGQAGANYSNANLVFATSFAYKSDFREPTWQYPLEIFAPPFMAAPGLVANALLRSPPVLGAAPNAPAAFHLVGNTTGGAPFPDAVGVSRLWRNISGNLLSSDGTCSVANRKQRHFCYFAQTPADTRIWWSTGPSTLAPGQSVLLVMVQVHAAPRRRRCRSSAAT